MLRRSPPAIASLLANVWRKSCHVKFLIFASRTNVPDALIGDAIAIPYGVVNTKSVGCASCDFHSRRIAIASAFSGTYLTLADFAVVALTVTSLEEKSMHSQVSR